MSGQLSPLLWQAFDSDPDARTALMTALASRASTTKELIGDDHAARQMALRQLPQYENARATFQTGFAAIDIAHNAPSPTHDVLAEWLHRGLLELIVSLNWDTQIEKAFERKYGRRIRVDGPDFYKLHGDAASPKGRWTYPGEETQIPDELSNRLSALPNERPRLLLVIGYSESDESIVQQLIRPLERRWKIVRVGPDVNASEDIQQNAEIAAQRVHSRMALPREVDGWEYVSFSTEADLGAALSGYSLGPSHVRTCPRLPEVDVVLRQLSISGRVALTGKPGSGKSITAYQVAHSLSENGWEILRPEGHGLSLQQISEIAPNLKRKTVLLLDDAHRIAPPLLRRIEELASNNTAVLAVFAEDLPEHANSVLIAGGRAVQVIAQALLERRREVLDIVRRLDDQVGDGYGDTRLEDRITEAKKAENAWQFNFILTGGWRRARQELAALRDLQRADLLLLGLAAGQLGVLGSAVGYDRLDPIVRSLGRGHVWLEESIGILCRRRMIMSKRDLRCPHLRLSTVVLKIICGLPKDPEWQSIVATLRLVLSQKDLPLRGVYWLLDELRFADGFRWSCGDLVDESTWRGLVNRCWTASVEDRGAACLLLEGLIDWYPGHLNELKEQSELLRQWFQEADPRWCMGASSLLNSLHNAAEVFAVDLCNGISHERLAWQLSRACVADGYVWGQFLDRIGVAGGEAWRRALDESLDRVALESLTADVATDDELWRITQLAVGVDCISSGAALGMIRLLATRIADRINRAPALADGEFSDVFWRVLGYAPDFLRFRSPKPEQTRVARTIVHKIDKTIVARAISEAQRWALEPLARLTSLIFEIEPSSTSVLLAGLDLCRLDEELGREWDHPRHELQVLLSVLAVGDQREPARSWITRHAADLQILTPRLVFIAPDAAVEVLRRGVPLQLGLSNGLDWIGAAAALYYLGQVNRELAGSVIQANHDDILRGFHLSQSNSCEKLVVFCEVLDNLMPGYLDSMLAELDAPVVEIHWKARLRGKTTERKAARFLLEVAARGTGPIASLARGLLRPVRQTARMKRIQT